MANHDSPVVPWIQGVTRFVNWHNGVPSPLLWEALPYSPVEDMCDQRGYSGGCVNQVLTL